MMTGAGAPMARQPGMNLTQQQIQRRQAFAQRRKEELARLQQEQERKQREAETKKRLDELALARSAPKAGRLPERRERRSGRGKMSLADWKRAIIMSEILAKPVSMREEATGPSSTGI